MVDMSFLNYNCLLRRLAKGARSRDFVRCYLSNGLLVVFSIDSVVCVDLGSSVFLGYSRKWCDDEQD